MKYRPCRHEPMQPDSCRLCWLALNNPKYALWANPLPEGVEYNVTKPNVPSSPKQWKKQLNCLHFGERLGGSSCGGWLHRCNYDGVVCSRSNCKDAERSCLKCEYSEVATTGFVSFGQPHIPKGDTQLIPKVFHRIWVGTKPIEKRFEEYWQHWQDQHPDATFITWGDADIAGFGPDCERLCKECRNPAEMSDVLRFFIVAKYGGIYLDADFDCYKCIWDLLKGWEFVTAWEHDDNMCGSAFFGAIPEHPILIGLVEKLSRATIDKTLNQVKTIGPRTFTDALGEVHAPGVCIFPNALFYHQPYTDREKQPVPPSDAYAVHRWAHTWEDYWCTVTWIVRGSKDRGLNLKTLESLQAIGEGDVVVMDANVKPETTHYCIVEGGDTFTTTGVKTIRSTLRFAADYGENDFAFRDDKGGWFRVFATTDRGNPIQRSDQVVLRRK